MPGTELPQQEWEVVPPIVTTVPGPPGPQGEPGEPGPPVESLGVELEGEIAVNEAGTPFTILELEIQSEGDYLLLVQAGYGGMASPIFHISVDGVPVATSEPFVGTSNTMFYVEVSNVTAGAIVSLTVEASNTEGKIIPAEPNDTRLSALKL